jgi:hypothetical protein
LVLQGIAGPFFTGFANNLLAGDDTTHVVALPYPFPFHGQLLSSVIVSSNGFVWLSTTNAGSGCCSGSVTTLLSSEPRIAAHWTDLYTSPGGVFADLDPATADFCITWNNVSEFGASSASNTFQIALKPSGIFEYRYQNIALLAHTSLTGFSGGLGATDPGGTDLSALTQFDTGPGGRPPDLHRVGTSLPQFGATMSLEVTGLAAGGGVAFLVLCYFQAVPEIDMGFLGAPGCQSQLDFLSAPIAALLALTGGSPTAAFSFVVPNNPALAGTQLFAQALGQDFNANPLGFKFSDAVRMVVGF